MRLLLQLQPIHICCFSWDLPGFVWNLKLGRFELAGQKAGGTSCCPNLLLFLVVRNNILYSFVSFFLLNFMKCSTIVMFLVTICKNPIDVSFNSPLVKVCDVRHVVPSFFLGCQKSQVEGAREVPLCAFCNWKLTIGWDPHRTPSATPRRGRRTAARSQKQIPGAREPMVKFVKLGIFAVSLCEGEWS